MIKGKKPTYQQKKLLQQFGYNPREYLYTGQRIDGREPSLGKAGIKVIIYKFVHRVTGEEVEVF